MIQETSPSPNSKPEPEPVLETLRGAFGQETVFIPVPRVFKGPSAAGLTSRPEDDEWKKTTLEQSRSVEHQAKLLNADIAVLCGPACGGLSSVLFSTEAALSAFLGWNPVLAEMGPLVTSHTEGFRVWFRILDTNMQTGFPLDGFWKADGFVQVHDQSDPDAKPCIFQDGRPIPVQFSWLKWSPVTTRLLLSDVVQYSYGEAFITDLKGEAKPNLWYWAKLFALQYDLVYEQEEKRFYQLEIRAVPATEETITAKLVEFLMYWFRVAKDPRFASMSDHGALKGLLASLKVVSAGDLPPEQDCLASFLSECVEEAPGQNLTTAELYKAHEDFAAEHSFAPLPETNFNRVVPEELKRRFGVRKSHCILRNGTSHRGFSHLRLKAPQTWTPRTARTQSPSQEGTPAPAAQTVA